MKLSNLINTDLFSILTSDYKDLYYDVVKMIEAHTSNTSLEGMLRNNAREKIVEIILSDPEYSKKIDGSERDETESRELAGKILLNLENKGWINKKEYIIEDTKIYISRAGNAILSGLKKLETKENSFEFKNALQRVYLITQSYNSLINDNENIYIGCLKEIYDNTIELRNNMYRFKNDFEELVKDLDKTMTPKELAIYIQEIASGYRMKNYYRIISSEDGLKAYETEIARFLKHIKIFEYEKFAEAYRVYSNKKDIEESEYYITDLISEILPFYEDEYLKLKCEMSNVITNYLRKVNNKCKITFSDMLNNYDPTENLLQIMGKIMDDPTDKYLPENLNSIFNLYDVSYLSLASLTHNIQKEKFEINLEDLNESEVTEDEINQCFEEIQKINNKMNSKSKIIKTLREKYNFKEEIKAEDFEVKNLEDYVFILNLIKFTNDDDFPYELTLFEDEEDIIVGNMKCTPFILVKKKENGEDIWN